MHLPLRRLLPAYCFEPIFGPLVGRRVGVVDGVGANVGDRLIYAATRQLLDHFTIDWQSVEPEQPEDTQILLLFGGGNLGSGYHGEVARRQRALQNRLPAIILPQSAYSAESVGGARVFLRETSGRRFYPDATVAPDLALGYAVKPTKPSQRGGLFLRRDGEGCFLSPRDQQRSLGDPIGFTLDPADYVLLAGRFENILTDRLHFAICGLMNGARTVLIRNRTEKNRGMWETWLRDLGCLWAETPDDALRLPDCSQ